MLARKWIALAAGVVTGSLLLSACGAGGGAVPSEEPVGGVEVSAPPEIDRAVEEAPVEEAASQRYGASREFLGGDFQ